MSVERFEPSGGGGQGAAYYEMDKASDGEWVRFEDYEKLHKELDTLSARFTALIQQNNTLAAENERLSEKLAAMESQNKGEYEYSNEYRDGVIRGYHLGQYGDDVMLAHILMHASDENLPEPLPVPADKPETQTLDSPARVNHTFFGVGVPHSTVVDAAQRYYQHMKEPQPDAETLASSQREMRQFMGMQKSEPAVAVPDVLARGWIHRRGPGDDYDIYDESSGVGNECDECVPCMVIAAPSHSQKSAEYGCLTKEELFSINHAIIYLKASGEKKMADNLDKIIGARLGDRCPSHESEQGGEA